MVIWKGPERIKIGRRLNKRKDIGDSISYSLVSLIFIFRKIKNLLIS